MEKSKLTDTEKGKMGDIKWVAHKEFILGGHQFCITITA
jgi:hypothetical protein